MLTFQIKFGLQHENQNQVVIVAVLEKWNKRTTREPKLLYLLIYNTLGPYVVDTMPNACAKVIQ